MYGSPAVLPATGATPGSGTALWVFVAPGMLNKEIQRTKGIERMG